MRVHLSQLRAATAASSAARIGSTGPGRPVISSTCATAWCSSISSPLTTRAPRSAAPPRRTASARARRRRPAPQPPEDGRAERVGGPRRQRGEHEVRATQRRRAWPGSASASSSLGFDPEPPRRRLQLVGPRHRPDQHRDLLHPELAQRRERGLGGTPGAEHHGPTHAYVRFP